MEEPKIGSTGTFGGLGIAVVMVFSGLLMFGLSHVDLQPDESWSSAFLLPFTIQTVGIAVVAPLGLLVRRLRNVCLIVSSLALALLFLPYFYANSQWPEGSIGWALFVGLGCAVSFLVGSVALGIGIASSGLSIATPAGRNRLGVWLLAMWLAGVAALVGAEFALVDFRTPGIGLPVGLVLFGTLLGYPRVIVLIWTGSRSTLFKLACAVPLWILALLVVIGSGAGLLSEMAREVSTSPYGP